LTSDGLALFRKEHCGFVFQQIYLIDTMSVLDNVLAAGLLVNKDKKAIAARARELFNAVDISEETIHKFPTQISGGQAQRAGIVRALINSPEILFADEPTGALNEATGRLVLDYICKLKVQYQYIRKQEHRLGYHEVNRETFKADTPPHNSHFDGRPLRVRKPSERPRHAV
ncbi:MAG: ATP-binding cassette domain-containing protein, partial [Muribaculaceae bacterium]|nr:ATP-binding cassette domain-containing protein [Muribaculaceae bacterium]